MTFNEQNGQAKKERRFTADPRFVTSSKFNDVTKAVRKRRQQLHARDGRGFVAFRFCPLEEKIVMKSCFPSISKVQTVFTSFQDPINTLN